MLEERSRRQRVSCAAENTSHEAAEKNVARLSLWCLPTVPSLPVPSAKISAHLAFTAST